MGLFNSIVGGLQQAASNGRNSTQLRLIFQENQGFAQLAQQTFERCVAERGLKVTSHMITDAQDELLMNPTQTMGEFLDGYTSAR